MRLSISQLEPIANEFMRRTLLLIPHEIAGLPVFGLGWAVILLAIALVIRAGMARRTGQSIGNVLASEGLMWIIAAAVLVFVLPAVELKNLDGDPVGMAIRGYGVMLLVAVSASVALASYRATRAGLDPEIILSLAMPAFIGGIVGARTFFVIQYYDQFVADSIWQTIGNMLKFTEGGLVVYGAFIGGSLAVTAVLLKKKLPVLALGDVIVPCMFLGVFFGRMGCLMNGCCYGGRCEEGPMALHFPPTSKVYSDQTYDGSLLGFAYDAKSRQITSVAGGGLAEKAGIQVGSTLNELGEDLAPLAIAPRDIPAEDARTGVIATVDGRRYRWTPDELPERAMPVQAAQLISSFSSLVLCLGLCGLSWFRFRPGTVMMAGFASYAVLRFVLEMVRVDEAGQFGTSLSISQWVSVVVLTFSLIGLAWISFSGSLISGRPEPTHDG